MKLDKDFKPAIIEIRKFNEDVAKQSKKQHLVIAVERELGYIYKKKFDVFEEGVDDERNNFITERIIKSILWVVGGYKIYIAGSHSIYEKINSYYKKDGLRSFDYDFMSTVYESPVEVIECTYDTIPSEKMSSNPCGGHVNGRRIGFDAGGSDMKVSAVLDGKIIHSEEIVWLPKLNSDPNYHFENIYKAMKIAVDKLGGDVDGIGVSSAGVYIDNKAMVSSLFVKVDKSIHFEETKNIYKRVVAKLEQELGHKIPYIVANDGDVTALAGALDLKDNCVLGIAMGTSEAVGYVNSDGNLNGWISELAFVPVDFNKNALIDEWSGDFGVGCKYFSQDAVIKLAKMANIDVPSELTLAEKLKFIQALANNGDETAKLIYEDIGEYLAYALAEYAEYYNIKHVLLLGRVTSGIGGDIILNKAREVLNEKFPEYKDFDIGMPSEYVRRVGQSIAAASLPKV